jgi:hypothetical protein
MGGDAFVDIRAILNGIMYVLSSKLPVAPDDGRVVVGRTASRDGAEAMAGGLIAIQVILP